MATQERLIKSLDSLKSILSSNLTTDPSKKKDKISHCNVIGDAMCNSSVKVATNFPNLLSFSIEILLQLCDDSESDVRMAADENLNRTIRAMSNGNIIKVQVELHKEIKKNGAARSLRAALWRFAQLCHMIRPHKGKPYVSNLIPCINKISERAEESLHETLALSLPKIMDVLGSFTTDNDVKCLLKSFLQNISNASAVLRRTAASCIVTVCTKCRKPHIFISYLLNTLLDLLIPVINSHPTPLVLGVLGCLRSILPHIKQNSADQELKGSFGAKRNLNDNNLSSNRMIQIYELCLHYACHTDHNIINAALETLNNLLQNAPIELINILLYSEGIIKSRIKVSDMSSLKLKHRSLSQLSVATTRTLADESTLIDTEISEINSDIEKWIQNSKMGPQALMEDPTPNLSLDTSLADTSIISNSELCEYSNIYIGQIDSSFEIIDANNSNAPNSNTQQIDDTNISDGIPSEKSSPKFVNEKTDDKNILFEDIDIGNFTDADVPLKYCTRFICKSFLLTGHSSHLVPDKIVRISVKSLALACLSNIIPYYPEAMLMYLENSAKCTTVNSAKYSDLSEDKQRVSDILLFSDHPDPQLRGNVSWLVGNLIRSVLQHSENDYGKWLLEKADAEFREILQIDILVKLLAKSLQDESSMCSRLTLVGIGNCLANVIESVNSLTVLPILNLLPTVGKNPYWLVKVKLVETISEIPFITLQFVTGNCEFQDKVIHNIIFTLLTDEDQRVRHASAVALVKIIEHLYNEKDLPNETITTTRAIHYRNKYLKNIFNTSLHNSLFDNRVLKNLPKPYNSLNLKTNYVVEQCLSRVVIYLSQKLLVPSCKYAAYGSSEALYLLSEKYETTRYYLAWSCNRLKNRTRSNNSSEIFQRSFSQTVDSPERQIESNYSSAAGLLNTCVTLMTTTTISHEITCHQWLLSLAGNMFSGIAVNNIKTTDELNPDAAKQIWDMYSDKLISEVAEQFLHHIVRLLNIFCHIIDETTPTLPPAKPVLSNLQSASNLSPIKRRSKGDLAAEKGKATLGRPSTEKDDKSEKKNENSKFNAMGYFANIPQYMKYYDILRMAHTNYKKTLDSEASEKFLQLLRSTLNTLAQVLEMASVTEMGRIAEELLFYLRSTVLLDSTATVHCVLQLLKCLFGTNLCFQINDVINLRKDAQENSSESPEKSGFYRNIFQLMYEKLTDNIEAVKNCNKIEKDTDQIVMGYLHRRDRKPVNSFRSLSRTADKTALANYIRLFEPMVIKALKQYTITSDVKLQCIVLQLLSHLVQLRVNYCLLDSDQIFIGYVMKQFEFIEEGQIQYAEELIPRIFQFLVHLSYEKQHSKSIIIVPKIINLCDGLMASGQSPLTHFIPAIIPLIEDIFVFRNQNNTVTDIKELEATRDVLFSMLLRLVEYPQVIQLLALVVNESKYCNDNGERWNRWSKQIAEILLPVLGQHRVKMESPKSQTAVYNLVVSLNPMVFKPITEVLKVLFSEPPMKQSPTTKSMNYWLGMILTLSMPISQVKEDVLLMRIGEIQTEFAVRSVFDVITNELVLDPLNVTNPSHILNGISASEIFARFIFRVVNITSDKCIAIFNEEGHCNNYIFEQFSVFLMYCIHMFQSGSHCKIANSAINLISLNNADSELVDLNSVNNIILKLAPFCPLLTLEWCYFLTLLNYNDSSFWSMVLRSPKCDRIVHLSPDSLKKSQKTSCMNLELVKIGGTILYCDYLCENISDAEQLTWLLVNHIEYIIRLSNEIPVFELIAAVHRNSAASGLFIHTIGARCPDIVEPCFIEKLLRSIENAHPSQSGDLLLLIIPRLLNCRQLSLSRLAASVASRKTELLLTLSVEEVNEQLPKDDLNIIINSLLKAKIIKKHETLVNLLNRLGSKYYDLSPIEFDQRRNLNPENIKNIVINKAWYLSQIKSQCTQLNNSGRESAELLNKLEYEDMLTIMSNIYFNHSILKDCIILIKREEGNRSSVQESPLLRATVVTVLNHIAYIKSLIPKPHQVYRADGREITPSESKYVKRVSELFSDSAFWQTFNKLVPIVTCYLESLFDLPNCRISDNHFEDFAKFGVLCLESLIYQIHNNSLTPHFMDIILNCVNMIFKQDNFCSTLGLDSYCSWLYSAVNSIYFLVQFLLLHHEPLPTIPINGLKKTLDNLETVAAGHTCYQLSSLIAWIKDTQSKTSPISQFLLKPIISIVISLSRLPIVNSFVLTPPNVWQTGWDVELTGTFNTHVPPLPIEFLQEIDILEEFIFRITLLGWTSRQQFEETWMCLLSVLSSSPNQESMPDEITSMIHSTSLSVQAITSLLLQTLLEPIPGDPHVSKYIHVPRDADIDCSQPTLSKLRAAQESLNSKYLEYAQLSSLKFPLKNIFKKANFESLYHSGYGYSQVSVEYLWIAVRIAEITKHESLATKAFLRREKYIKESGLDLHSCLQFLLDLYSQWLKPQNNTALRLLHEVVKSILVLSDIFTEKSQFTWMLDTFLSLSKTHPTEDEILHQYIIIGICKATAVLTPDLDTYDTVKKMVATSLKSGFLPTKIASLHGILYLSQSSVIANTVIGGSSEEMQLIHPLAIDYIQAYINSSANALTQSEDHQLIMWAMAFFLLENVEEQITDTDIAPSVLQVALNLLSQHSIPLAIHNSLMQGLERLIVKKCISGKVMDQITNIALEKLKNNNPNYALPGLQLLLTCMYNMNNTKLQMLTPTTEGVGTDPEFFVQMIEKVSAIFDRIKRSCPFEVELLCSVLPNILNDFFPPSEILTKVIGEFLSPQQPHPKILSGVVFLVFEKACDQFQLLLLQDWVVCSLSNFTQSLPVSMSTWCLTCFFISASTNPWLRAIFPYIQSRIGRYEYEDKKMLCIAGADFYRSLNNENQQKSFVESFNKVKDIAGTPFKDLIACL